MSEAKSPAPKTVVDVMKAYARRRSAREPACAAVVLHALDLPGVDQQTNAGPYHGRIVMASYDVAALLGLESGWSEGPMADRLRTFVDAMNDHVARIARSVSEAKTCRTVHLAVDGSVFLVERSVSTMLRERFERRNAKLVDRARKDAVASAVTIETAGVPVASAGAPLTLVVCADVERPVRIPGFPADRQDWSILGTALPLLGGSTDLGAAGSIESLREDMPWMAGVIDRVEERLVLLRSLDRGWTSLPPILVHGPSGVGKSYFARRLARTIGLGFAETSLAGSTDNREMEGTGRGWTNARPCWPICSIARLRTANPLLFVDEVDKVDSFIHGNPLRTVLTMLDRETAARYPDKGLALPCDISRVSWLLAANEVQLLDTALRDRVEIVRVGAPAAEHLGRVVENVIADMAQDLLVDRARLPSMGDLAMRRIEDAYASRRSLRGVAAHVHGEISRMASMGLRSPSEVELG